MASLWAMARAVALEAATFGTVPYIMVGFIPSSCICAFEAMKAKPQHLEGVAVLGMPVILVCTFAGPYLLPALAAGYAGSLLQPRS